MIVKNYNFYINNILSTAEKDFQVLYKYNKTLKSTSIDKFIDKLIANNFPNADGELKNQLKQYFLIVNDLKWQKAKVNAIITQYFIDNSNL